MSPTVWPGIASQIFTVFAVIGQTTQYVVSGLAVVKGQHKTCLAYWTCSLGVHAGATDVAADALLCQVGHHKSL
jgi:hypothetical protein